ncbi:MAG: HK97 family phage prohead protease, partial [Gammaproteobacteria bacterium]|nr:HK97 family phage prohead protease [Gammaproteobacteria bacterium]
IRSFSLPLNQAVRGLLSSLKIRRALRGYGFSDRGNLGGVNMDTIFKTFRAEIKSANEETGEIDMLIPMSTASIDRDGESIDPMGWKKSLPAFRKRPILLSSHNYGDLRKQIGEFTRIKATPEGLFAKPKYYVNEGNEEADWAFKLASRGVAAYSVGFMPVKWEDGDGEKEPRRTYTEQELLEISHVTVPSNRDAIQGLRSKSADDPIMTEILDEAEKELPEIKKPEKVGQASIADEIDYLLSLIQTEGLNTDNISQAQELADEIRRITGDDIPDEIDKGIEFKDIRDALKNIGGRQNVN